ncbi:ATP-binding protein [Streptomyces sp. H27-H1]|uniref:ATP-binding protein n=1 Tax=Streptomyces sp. H27-H1 TaxID=2996461 RepID=UPI00226F8831|nr:ATP-binding protein [Streptomyces sp. H27-H1]MCY0932296.1 ATP-binding protein [Streptomyces sp. H27-H1]
MTLSRTALISIHPCRDQAAREARALVSDVLDECRRSGCEEAGSRADEVLLVVSELVTNACRHAGGADLVRVVWQQGELRVEVEDASDTMPREPAEEAKGEAGGYGCQLVTALADRWGAVPRRSAETGPDKVGGKTVYAEFTLL